MCAGFPRRPPRRIAGAGAYLHSSQCVASCPNNKGTCQSILRPVSPCRREVPAGIRKRAGAASPSKTSCCRTLTPITAPWTTVIIRLPAMPACRACGACRRPTGRAGTETAKGGILLRVGCAVARMSFPLAGGGGVPTRDAWASGRGVCSGPFLIHAFAPTHHAFSVSLSLSSQSAHSCIMAVRSGRYCAWL